jgi:type IV pilus assembly protein PilC
MARFTRTFSSLTSSGLPLIDVFVISGETIGNSLYEDDIKKMSQEVKAGQSISSVLKKSPYMPKMVGQLASVGEKSGNIDEVFNTLADFFDRDVENITSNLSTMLEPILMVVMGVGIGIIIVAVLQPIYSMVNAV